MLHHHFRNNFVQILVRVYNCIVFVKC